MIVTVGGQKGGSGKTTICVNLALVMASLKPEYRVAIVDCDEQRSVTQILKNHGRHNLTVQPVVDVPHKHLEKMKANFDVIFVDTPPHSSEILYHAMSESDVVLFPIQPSSIEVRSAIVTVKAAKMISEQYNPDMICRFVANRVWPGKSSLTQELLDACAKYFPQVPLCDTMIYERHAYRQAITNGRSLSEFRRSPAASEIADLLAEVIRIYGLSQKAKLITASN